jgi:hypothetical protein
LVFTIFPKVQGKILHSIPRFSAQSRGLSPASPPVEVLVVGLSVGVSAEVLAEVLAEQREDSPRVA